MTRRPIDPHVDSGGGRAEAEDEEGARVRDAFSHWASGVAVVAARDDDGRLYAMTVAALTPVSVEPPLVLACIHNDAPLASVLAAGVRCGISILSEGQKRAASTFADRYTVPGDLFVDDGGVPLIVEAAATLMGEVVRVDDGGDHRVVVVRVANPATRPELPPLLYWRRAYRRLEP